MVKIKADWINKFRNKGNQILDELSLSNKDINEKTKLLNTRINKFREEEIIKIKSEAIKYKRSNDDILNEILIMTYASYIILLEYRDLIWEYDYMTFSRRIGELWEPFCKLPFEYSSSNLKLIKAPNFNKYQESIKNEAISFLNGITIDQEIRDKIMGYYEIPWILVDSGGIKLELDLHFELNGTNYNCDFKSGFSSNEKGNTNRLLLVASIYNSLSNNEKTILFIRQKEDENNHYLRTLKNSQFWDVYCSVDCYSKIHEFTGFNLREWIDINIDWENDISNSFKTNLINKGLLKYLTW